MKKILGILLIAGALVACNDSADSTDNSADSARIADSLRQDSIDKAAASMPTDSTTMGDSTNMVDSTNMPK